MRRDVTEKPGEWDAPPMVPASWNFEAARKMAVENLEHQPLPDAIMDKAFRRVQALGARNPELALNVVPTATGMLMCAHDLWHTLNRTVWFFCVQFIGS